jgi:hypothetical protein
MAFALLMDRLANILMRLRCDHIKDTNTLPQSNGHR